jgi:ribonuclease D
MKHPSPPLKIVPVNNQERLDQVCAQCRRDGQFAFDTEFVMEDRFEPEVCLIQIAVGDTSYIIDPFLELEIACVWELVCDAEVETVVHAGQEDLAFCMQHLGRTPRRICDVQIAAGFVGYDYPLSLQKLVRQCVGARLHKSKTLTDWRRRPLTEAQIQYGAEDVCYLLAVWRQVQERLKRSKRLEWVREEFAKFEDANLYERPEEEKLARLKGAGGLKGQALAVVRSLLSWRQVLAERRNRPARVALKDHLLVEIARHGLSTFEEARDLRGLNLADRDIHDLCRVVREALDSPKEKWPVPRRQDTETPHESVLIALSTAVVRAYCLEEDIAYGLAASKKSIMEMVRYCVNGSSTRENVELLRGWRRQTVGAILEGVLRGQRVIQVDGKSGHNLISTPSA